MMAGWQEFHTGLRTKAARLFRRFPWFVAFLQRGYAAFRPRFTAGAVGLVFSPEGKVLLVEHILHPRHPWGPPGGWVDANETPAESAIREVYEEVGLRVEVESLISINFLPQKHHVTFVYLCIADNYEINRLSPELIGYGWYLQDDLPNVYPYIREAIQLVQSKQALSSANRQDL